MQMVEVELASPPQMNSVFIATLAFFGGFTLLLVKVN
jgi:hypothetical protein